MQNEMKVLNLRKNFSFLENLDYYVGPEAIESEGNEEDNDNH